MEFGQTKGKKRNKQMGVMLSLPCMDPGVDMSIVPSLQQLLTVQTITSSLHEVQCCKHSFTFLNVHEAHFNSRARFFCGQVIDDREKREPIPPSPR